jgi:hypothetical protein
MLALIGAALAKEGVSIAGVEQPEGRENGPVPIHLITHPTPIEPLSDAVEKLVREQPEVAPPFRSLIAEPSAEEVV